MGWGRYCYIGVGVDIKIWGGGVHLEVARSYGHLSPV